MLRIPPRYLPPHDYELCLDFDQHPPARSIERIVDRVRLDVAIDPSAAPMDDDRFRALFREVAGDAPDNIFPIEEDPA